MVALEKFTEEFISQMPPSTVFTAKDYDIIAANQELLLGLEENLVQGFYNTLFDHSKTASIFVEGERPDREETLRKWWQRTIKGPFDNSYWVWQTLVGLIHVKRKVKNTMMIAMWGWILTTLRNELTGKLPEGEIGKVMEAFERLAATVQALTAESYLEHYLMALQKSTGFELSLLDNLVATEVEAILEKVKGS